MTDCSCTNFPASLGNVTFEADATLTAEVAIVPSGFGGSSGNGPGNLDVAGNQASLNVWRRTLTAFPASPAAGDRYALYSPDGSLRVYTPGGGDLLTILPNGQVGIGITAPLTTLHVQGVSGLHLRSLAGAPEGGRISFFGDGTGYALYVQSRDDAGVAHTPIAAFVEHSTGGQVGIGTTTPTQTLDVSGTARATTFIAGSRTVADGSGCYYS